MLVESLEIEIWLADPESTENTSWSGTAAFSGSTGARLGWLEVLGRAVELISPIGDELGGEADGAPATLGKKKSVSFRLGAAGLIAFVEDNLAIKEVAVEGRRSTAHVIHD